MLHIIQFRILFPSLFLCFQYNRTSELEFVSSFVRSGTSLTSQDTYIDWQCLHMVWYVNIWHEKRRSN